MFPNYKSVQIGEFEVVSGQLICSDPCYLKENISVDGCVLQNVKKGRWLATLLLRTNENYAIVAGLRVMHEEASTPIYKNDTEIADNSVYVDSGQAGIFDAEHFRDNSVVDGETFKHNYGIPWYNKCCDLTLSEQQGGVLPYGAVSASGYGDGSYICKFKMDEAGQIDYVRIEFE